MTDRKKKAGIPVSRPVLGEDLESLRDLLRLSASDACYLYGFNMQQWTNQVRKDGARKPIKNITRALLVRRLAQYPRTSPLRQAPSADEMFELIGTVRAISETPRRKGANRDIPELDKKRFAIMFGCEASSGYRWLKKRNRISPPVQRLFVMLKTWIEMATAEAQAAAQAAGADDQAVQQARAEAALDVVERWEQYVDLEAKDRGISDIWLKGRWNVAEGFERKKPVTGGDLAMLALKLNYKTADACHLFGFSMSAWSATIHKERVTPLEDASLSMLVRILKEHPRLSPIPRRAKPHEVYSYLTDLLPERYDKKRFGIAFGSEASGGYRWITTASEISPVLGRLLELFLSDIEDALGDEDQTEEQWAASRQVAISRIDEWEEMVIAEAAARGVDDIFRTGKWNKKGDDGDEASEEVDADLDEDVPA